MNRTSRIACLLSALLVSACDKPTTYAPTATAQEIEEEQRIQQQLVNEAQGAGGTKKNWKNDREGLNHFESIASRIEQAGADVCRELNLPALNRSCYYRFGIKEGDELNAYADGENVVVYQGMMHFLHSDAELASVLAHELAHNLMAHPASTQKNATAGGLLGMAVDTLAQTQGVATNGQFTRMGATSGVLTYSVPYEQEADYVGLYIMDRAGFDIAQAPLLWRRMSLENPRGIYNSTTHPTNAERFVALRKTINEIKSKRQLGMEMLPERYPVNAK